MIRLKNGRLKLLICLISICVFFIYLIKNHYYSFKTNNIILDYSNENNYDLNLDEFKYDTKKLWKSNKSQELHLIILKNDLDLNKELELDLKYVDELKVNSKSAIANLSDFSYKLIDGNSRQFKEKYLILEYTKVFFQPKFCSKSREDIFNSQLESCEYSNCFYTCDKETNLQKADALIFHQRDLETEYKVKYKSDFQSWIDNTQQIPFKMVNDKLANNPNQIWILWNDEATHIDSQFDKISSLFNWTLSYKSDSEIYEGSYGFFQYNTDITKEKLVHLKKDVYLNQFEKRHNAILWFVSNCNSKIRMNIALSISKYYPLHIYGNCDPLEGMDTSDRVKQYPYLKVTKFNKAKASCEPLSHCETTKLNSYKYYLAFENRNCTDYITEKLWRSLDKNLIPIVFQPSEDSFMRYSIPPKSYLHLNNFNDDPVLLSKYLWAMNGDFNMYYEHLKWTYIYMKTVYDVKLTEPHRMCQLCKKLNTFKSRNSYKKIAGFFNDNCKT